MFNISFWLGFYQKLKPCCSNELRFFFVLLGLLIISSCKDELPEAPDSNSITLSSETFGLQPYYSMAYSFENHDFFQRLGSSSLIDIYLIELLKPSGELTGVQFSTNTLSETTFGFFLNAELDNLADAEMFYNNYTLADFPDHETMTLTDTVKVFQVYTFRTWKSNYVKFLVKDIRFVYDGSFADFMEVDIEYFIQRDGTNNLAN